MIDIQTIVDNAIDSNTEAYIEAYNQYDSWVGYKSNDGLSEKYRFFYKSKIDTIEETILNMFGIGHREYIESKFTNIRYNIRHK